MGVTILERARLYWTGLQHHRHHARHRQNRPSSKNKRPSKNSISTKIFSRTLLHQRLVHNLEYLLRHDLWLMKNVSYHIHLHLIEAKGPSSLTKALKPMVRNRLSNMGGPSMQRQGSGSSPPKSGRGNNTNFGRAGNGSDVWSWRRQPTAQREYSEEELQKQGVHLTARLTASTGDDANKWADVFPIPRNSINIRWTMTGRTKM
jgi:hypothetical protein